MSNNPPVQTLRDGALKASIWRNDRGDGGQFYSVTLGRTYTDDQDKVQTADNFSGSHLLKLAHLMGRVYDRLAELREIDKKRAA